MSPWPDLDSLTVAVLTGIPKHRRERYRTLSSPGPRAKLRMVFFRAVGAKFVDDDRRALSMSRVGGPSARSLACRKRPPAQGSGDSFSSTVAQMRVGTTSSRPATSMICGTLLWTDMGVSVSQQRHPPDERDRTAQGARRFRARFAKDEPSILS